MYFFFTQIPYIFSILITTDGRNLLWQYLFEPTPDKAKCNICSKLLSIGAEAGKKKKQHKHLESPEVSPPPCLKEAHKKKEDVDRADSLQPTITKMFDAQRPLSAAPSQALQC